MIKNEMVKKDIEFNAEGVTLRGWLYLPNDSTKKFPAIIMAHGFASVKEMHLDKYAEKFAQNKFSVIVFDYSGFGGSDGYPRQEVNPYKQIEEYSHAITYATTLKEVDSEKIGIWGTSYSGGHVLVVAERDHRVKCVVSQVPTISGSETSQRRVSSEKQVSLLESIEKDLKGRMQGEKPIMKVLTSNNQSDNPNFGSEEAVKWYTESGSKSKDWKNEITLKSVSYSRSYNPGKSVSNIISIPLLMIIARSDKVTPTDLALKAYENVLEPKKIEFINGGHFDPYIEEFEASSGAALNWFEKNLQI